MTWMGSCKTAAMLQTAPIHPPSNHKAWLEDNGTGNLRLSPILQMTVTAAPCHPSLPSRIRIKPLVTTPGNAINPPPCPIPVSYLLSGFSISFLSLPPTPTQRCLSIDNKYHISSNLQHLFRTSTFLHLLRNSKQKEKEEEEDKWQEEN